MPLFKVVLGVLSFHRVTSPTFPLSPSHLSHLQTAAPRSSCLSDSCRFGSPGDELSSFLVPEDAGN